MFSIKPVLHLATGLALGAGLMGVFQPALARNLLAPEAPISAAKFTYQGRLNKGNSPFTGTCNAAFKLFDAASAGTQIGSTSAFPTLAVEKGLFTVELDFGWSAFNTQTRWLETTIGCGEAPVTLSPRTAINPAPYALALPGMRTVPSSDGTSMNVIGGEDDNVIAPANIAAVIAGGEGNAIEASTPPVAPNASFSSIGGGKGNVIRGRSYQSTIGGGKDNVLSGTHDAVIGGGSGNQNLGGWYGTIAGGQQNVIANFSDFATIPGGQEAKANSYGQQAYASGGFGGVAGNAQTSVYVLRGISTTPVSKTLTLNGNAAGSIGSNEIKVPHGAAFAFSIQLIGVTPVTGTAGVAAEYRANGYVLCEGSPTSTSTNQSWNAPADLNPRDPPFPLSPTPLLDVDFLGGFSGYCILRVSASGVSSGQARWVATVRTTEVSW